jgi:hypothetical protein
MFPFLLSQLYSLNVTAFPTVAQFSLITQVVSPVHSDILSTSVLCYHGEAMYVEKEWLLLFL